MNSHQQRIIRELRQCQKIEKHQISYVYEHPDQHNQWQAFLLGPTDSPYADGVFMLSIRFPGDYPISPPEIKFITKIFHPNVLQSTGEICLEVLKNDWQPFWTIQSTLQAIQILLANPNAESPLNCDAGNLLRNNDRATFEAMAKAFTRQFALDGEQFRREREELEREYPAVYKE